MAAGELLTRNDDEWAFTASTIARLVNFTRKDLAQNGLSAAQCARAAAASVAQCSSGLGDGVVCPGSVHSYATKTLGIQSIGSFPSVD